MLSERTAVRLKDIASECRLSVATVSRILRRTDQCSHMTRVRVIAMAEAMGYRPNLLVQGIQSGRTRTIGVMVPLGDEFFGKIANGIHNGLVAHDNVPIFVWPKPGNLPTQPTDELAQLHRLIDRRVDGIILRPNRDNIDDEYLSEVWHRNLPLVAVDRALGNTRADYVGTDDEFGARLAAEHLLSLGHCRFAHLAGPEQVTTAALRRRGFESTVGTKRGTTFVWETDESFGHRSFDAALRLLRKTPRPTAIFCANDYQLPGLYRAAASLQIDIPRDLSVVGFADLGIASYLSPAATTIRQDPEAIGQAAAELLLNRIGGLCSDKMAISSRLKPELVIRNSTARVWG